MNLFTFITLLTMTVGSSLADDDRGALVAVESEPTVEKIIHDENIEYEPFYPTHEWQVVNDNQAIPAGLHVQMNFQTGIKEAKLMDGDDGSKYSTKKSDSITESKSKENVSPKIVINNGEGKLDNTKDKIYFTKNDLKEALGEYRDKLGKTPLNEDGTIKFSRTTEEVQQDEQVRKKFRSMDEIRAELSETMNLKIQKSDVIIMKELVDGLVSENKTMEERTVALDQLEDYAHQVDNANDMDKIGAMQIIVNLLNHSSHALVERAANVISAAVQNNLGAQTAALSRGALENLLRLLSRQEVSVKKKGLYALSALLRGFPEAQHAFVKLGGLPLVHGIMRNPEFAQLRLKSMNLISNLIAELGEATERTGRFSLDRELQEVGWCSELTSFLTQANDMSDKEKILRAANSSRHLCARSFAKQSQKNIFKQTSDELVEKIKVEEDEEFRDYLKDLKKLLEDATNGS